MICGLSRCPLPEVSTGEAPGKPWERVRGRVNGRFWPRDQLGPALRALVTHQCAAGPAQCRSTRTRKRWLFVPRPSSIACQIRATLLVGVELRYRRLEEADVSVRSLPVSTTAPRCAHAASCLPTWWATGPFRMRTAMAAPWGDRTVGMNSWLDSAPEDPDEWVPPLCRGYWQTPSHGENRGSSPLGSVISNT